MRPEHKDVFLSAVPVHIDVELKVVRFEALFAVSTCYVLCHALDVPHGRVQTVVRLIEFPIQVVSAHRCAIVADHNAVGVQHRHYFEHDTLAQLLCL